MQKGPGRLAGTLLFLTQDSLGVTAKSLKFKNKLDPQEPDGGSWAKETGGGLGTSFGANTAEIG
jgi:hypothetical protein